jgi:alcohol dehydrogenase class IV
MPEFELKTKTRFGIGEALLLGQCLKELKFKKIGIIVDLGVYKTSYFKEILEGIKKEGFDKVKVWEYDLAGEPDYDSLDRIKLKFMEGNSKPLVDCFVGVGGGSVIDFAKGLATLVQNHGQSRNYRGFPVGINPSLPTVALPTTAGTGSEVTFNAVFIDWKEKKKLGINTKYNFPVLAIVDPKLTLSCPREALVSSAIDALVHNLEGYVSKKADILTRIFAKEGFGLAFNSLPKVMNNLNDLESRLNLQLGAYFGGLTLLGSGGGVTGALSYALGVNFKVPHGLAGGMFLPYVVRYNVKGGYDYSQFYDVIKGADKSFNKRKKNQIFSERLFRLWKKVGVPLGLKDFGVNGENVSLLLKEIENFEKAFAQNPVPFSVEEGKKLILALIK